ncbi:hypothetical protein RHGRI_003292 [Rhododendron griersonianum]|uniref:Uncharacterized protein n=1 Tax=Rhododendron griersonianum TaxID=479676 RepID=A0AAV6L4F0_9ERIC|nr:hypothetical protein RHGRI_003292 [Rhododendron griersonianum]
MLGFLNSEEAGLFLVAGALCGASITVGGVGRVVYDWVIDAEAKEAKALLAWRRSKLEALQASTEEMKGIKESIVEFTKVLKMPRPAAKEPPTTGTGGSA